MQVSSPSTTMFNPFAPYGFYAPITDPPTWKAALQLEFEKDYFKDLAHQLAIDYSTKRIFPPSHQIFNAFNLTPLDQVRVVILGQDPYHEAGQAMGLSFSVPMGIMPPPSLMNIYKELHVDRCINRFTYPGHGCLVKWAQQGVFLLNTILTVEESKPLSHSKYGWQKFTDEVIRIIDHQRSGVVFLLLGMEAQMKEDLIVKSRDDVIYAPHPSPENFDGNIIGSGCFSEVNDKLETPIDWSLKRIN